MTESTRITTPFSFASTAAEVLDGVDLTGRRALLTGEASGIGIETARALAGAGAEVTLAVRNPEAGERTAEEIIATTGNKRVLVAGLDLADQASVRALAGGWEGPLHILVGNAGVMASRTCVRRSSSRTSTSASAPTRRGRRTGSPRRPTSCSRSRRPGAGPATASPSTR